MSVPLERLVQKRDGGRDVKDMALPVEAQLHRVLVACGVVATAGLACREATD